MLLTFRVLHPGRLAGHRVHADDAITVEVDEAGRDLRGFAVVGTVVPLTLAFVLALEAAGAVERVTVPSAAWPLTRLGRPPLRRGPLRLLGGGQAVVSGGEAEQQPPPVPTPAA